MQGYTKLICLVPGHSTCSAVLIGMFVKMLWIKYNIAATTQRTLTCTQASMHFEHSSHVYWLFDYYFKRSYKWDWVLAFWEYTHFIVWYYRTQFISNYSVQTPKAKLLSMLPEIMVLFREKWGWWKGLKNSFYTLKLISNYLKIKTHWSTLLLQC